MPIRVDNLTMAFGSFVLQRDLTFDINRGDIFVIMGGSGCGKSTLLRHLIGLKAPAKGSDALLWAKPVGRRAGGPTRRSFAIPASFIRKVRSGAR